MYNEVRRMDDATRMGDMSTIVFSQVKVSVF